MVAGMRVVPVPCLGDNYAYLVARDGAREAVVVDPSEAEPVLAALAREGLELSAILNTHHHYDHVGGNEALRARLGDLPVYGHESSLAEKRIPAQTVGVKEGEFFEAAGLSFRPLHVPGHTLDAVAYVVEDAVFTGDTLFVAGCGRIFEGTPEMMYASLCQKLARLPGETRVYCGHEYTVNNLRFAEAAEPDNEDVKRALADARALRQRGEPTVPSTMASELRINPFLRVDTPSVRARYAGTNGAEVLGEVRKAKDGFR
jgi:hydroxyacylglutathione hydrolase